MARYKMKNPAKMTFQYRNLKELREIRRPHLYDSFSKHRERQQNLLMTSVRARVEFLELRLAGAALEGHSFNQQLNAALAELVFGYGVEKLANGLDIHSTTLYRTLSFEGKQQLRVDRVDQILRFFGMRLQVVPLSPYELRLAAKSRSRKVASD